VTLGWRERKPSLSKKPIARAGQITQPSAGFAEAGD